MKGLVCCKFADKAELEAEGRRKKLEEWRKQREGISVSGAPKRTSNGASKKDVSLLYDQAMRIRLEHKYSDIICSIFFFFALVPLSWLRNTFFGQTAYGKKTAGRYYSTACG